MPVAPTPARDFAPRLVEPADVPELVAWLYSPQRSTAVVGVTTTGRGGRPHLDPEDLAERLGAAARVVVIPTGDSTWALTEALPDKLDVYGGAVRLWWPGLTPTSDPYKHPLLFARSADDGQRVVQRLLVALRPRTLPAAGAAPAAPPPVLDPWERVAEGYKVGDVVWGLVVSLKHFGVFVELLPGAVGLVRLGEVDWTRVGHPREIVKAGEQVKVQILALDPVARKADLSLKRAILRDPLPPLAPAPGGAPLLAEAPEAPRPAPGDPDSVAALETELRAEVETLREERANLLRRVRDLQKDLRGANDRLAHVSRQMEVDPTATENAFLLGVRLAYARLFSEDDRARYPLARMRVGPEFLDRLRALEGVSVDKVLEVAAQVAAGRAHEIPGREVHRLRLGERGAAYRERRRDGAAAWRCSLQDATASARRLHWWVIPGPDGPTIEFGSVSIHDDYSIPE